MTKIRIVNGPNLNILGRRQPDIYGSASMDDILAALRQEFSLVEIEYFQSNHEGALIDCLQQTDAQGVVLNAGGYTHTSVALADAVATMDIPVVEVHLSNIYAREEFRRQSLLSAVCAGTITGFGPAVYGLAITALINLKT